MRVSDNLERRRTDSLNYAKRPTIRLKEQICRGPHVRVLRFRITVIGVIILMTIMIIKMMTVLVRSPSTKFIIINTKIIMKIKLVVIILMINIMMICCYR